MCIPMARTRRAQILMEPQEYRRLEAIARVKKVSVAELICRAVRDRYFPPPPPNAKALVEGFFKLNLPVSDWEEMEREIESRWDPCDGLP